MFKILFGQYFPILIQESIFVSTPTIISEFMLVTILTNCYFSVTQWSLDLHLILKWVLIGLVVCFILFGEECEFLEQRFLVRRYVLGRLDYLTDRTEMNNGRVKCPLW